MLIPLKKKAGFHSALEVMKIIWPLVRLHLALVWFCHTRYQSTLIMGRDGEDVLISSLAKTQGHTSYTEVGHSREQLAERSGRHCC